MGASLTKTETGLACNTPYTRYAWAYSTCGNSIATTLNETTSTCGCPGTPTVSYGGKIYNTVQIGSQCWMAENLSIGTMINGLVYQTDNGIIEKYCYDNLESNCDIYGGLYQWAETVQYLNGATNTTSWSPMPSGNVIGICPTGWHIPKEEEWCTLTQYLDPTVVICPYGTWTGIDVGGKMKETGTLHWFPPNTGATNSSGFTALPGGYNNLPIVSKFKNLGTHGNFWSSTQYYYSPSIKARRFFLMYNDQRVADGGVYKAYGYSVRCLKD